MAVELANIPYFLVALLIGFGFHEFAHAYVADKLGDPTPRLQGRVSLLPHKHIDPIGFIAFFLVGFGWGKPVEVNPLNFSKPRRDDILVSLAGPVSNLIIVAVTFIIWYGAIALGVEDLLGAANFDIAYNFFDHIVNLNIVLCIFNLLPIPPLDGFHVFKGFVFHGEYLDKVEALERNMSIIGLIIIATPIGDFIIQPVFNTLAPAIFNIFDMPLARLFGLS